MIRLKLLTELLVEMFWLLARKHNYHKPTKKKHILWKQYDNDQIISRYYYRVYIAYTVPVTDSQQAVYCTANKVNFLSEQPT